jgi:hypothetical protein
MVEVHAISGSRGLYGEGRSPPDHDQVRFPLACCQRFHSLPSSSVKAIGTLDDSREVGLPGSRFPGMCWVRTSKDGRGCRREAMVL